MLPTPKARTIAEREGFSYNCIMYDTKKPDVVRFDEAPDFDTAREPITGEYLTVDTATGEATKSKSPSLQIWHNKWMWVKDDYKGFDVNEAYEWSKTWNQEIGNPDGWSYKWDYLLDQAGLPKDWTGSALAEGPSQSAGTGNRVRFSEEEYEPTVENFNRQFNEDLQDFIDGKLPAGHIFDLGDTSELMGKVGLAGWPIEMKAERLNNKKQQENHPYPAETVKDLVDGINNPLGVFRSISHPNCFVILTDIKHDDMNFVVIIRPFTKKGGNVYDVRSLYPKNNKALISWLAEDWDAENDKQYDNGNVLYLRPGFGKEWLEPTKFKLRSKQRSNSAEVRTELNNAAKIAQLFESPNYFEEKAGKSTESGKVNFSVEIPEMPASVKDYEERHEIKRWDDLVSNITQHYKNRDIAGLKRDRDAHANNAKYWARQLKRDLKNGFDDNDGFIKDHRAWVDQDNALSQCVKEALEDLTRMPPMRTAISTTIKIAFRFLTQSGILSLCLHISMTHLQRLAYPRFMNLYIWHMRSWTKQQETDLSTLSFAIIVPTPKEMILSTNYTYLMIPVIGQRKRWPTITKRGQKDLGLMNFCQVK